MGNSHPRTSGSPKNIEIRTPPIIDNSGSVPAERTETSNEETIERKEKSVLQAKLTKLAIQIGYAGIKQNLYFFLILIKYTSNVFPFLKKY